MCHLTSSLVSVFLQALDDYDGIVILTSNRVGTFDPVIKSRIQLAFHYKDLGVAERKQIWQNLFAHLRSMDSNNIDFGDIESHVSELAEYEINGREVRSAISTARKLARFKGEKMGFVHLDQALKMMGRFDAYFKKI